MTGEGEIDKINQDIQRRFTQIADKLQTCQNAVSFFETLLTEIESQFQVPFVWLSLIDDERNAALIQALQTSARLNPKLNLIKRSEWNRLMKDAATPLLLNGDLKPYYKLFPAAQKYFVRSMAIVPMAVHHGIIGVWINGDVLPQRYQPGMRTDYLERFAGLVSQRLSEIV